MKLINPIIILAIILVSQGCEKKNKANTPEQVLDSYVHAAFSANSVADKQKLVDLSTADAQDLLKKMTEIEFKNEFLDKHLTLVSLVTKDVRREDPKNISLVYELTYKEGTGDKSAAMTNKKIAYLTQIENGEWRIKATKNIKSFIEEKEGLVVSPQGPVLAAPPNNITEQKK